MKWMIINNRLSLCTVSIIEDGMVSSLHEYLLDGRFYQMKGGGGGAGRGDSLDMALKFTDVHPMRGLV